jgi:hypothetical protein
MSTKSRRSLWLTFCTAFLTIVTISSFGADTKRVPESRDSKKNQVEDPDAAAKVKRQREGSSLRDVAGTFHLANERYSFRQIEGGREYRTLENLALERITRTLGQHAENRFWAVSGTIMEFQGENYLLITRAVLKSKTEAAAIGRDN